MDRINTTDSWSPPSFVVDSAKRLLADPSSFGFEGTREFEALVIRLSTDRQMQSVWRELFRPKGEGKFFYPPKLDSINPYSGFLKYAEERSAKLQIMGANADAAKELQSLAVRAKHLRAFEKDATVKLSCLPAIFR